MTSIENKETLVKTSKETFEELRKINKKLRKLKDKAETPIYYKNMSYEEMKNIHLPNLEERRFTPTKNIIKFIRTIIEKTKNTNLTEDILIKIIKKRTSRNVYKKLKIQVLIHVNHTIEDIIKFFFYKGLLLSKKIKRRFN